MKAAWFSGSSRTGRLGGWRHTRRRLSYEQVSRLCYALLWRRAGAPPANGLALTDRRAAGYFFGRPTRERFIRAASEALARGQPRARADPYTTCGLHSYGASCLLSVSPQREPANEQLVQITIRYLLLRAIRNGGDEARGFGVLRAGGASAWPTARRGTTVRPRNTRQWRQRKGPPRAEPAAAMPRPATLAGDALVGTLAGKHPEPEPEPEPEEAPHGGSGPVACHAFCSHGARLVLHVLASAAASGAVAGLVASCGGASPSSSTRLQALVPDAWRGGVALGVDLHHRLRPNDPFVAWARRAAPRLLPAAWAGAAQAASWLDGPPPPPPPLSTCALMGLHDCPSRSHWTRGCAIECPETGAAARVPEEAEVAALPPLTGWQAVTGLLSLLLVLMLLGAALTLVRSLPRCVDPKPPRCHHRVT